MAMATTMGTKHVAHAVAETLDVGAAGLRALHGGDDVRERGAFAGCRHAHNEPTIQIHRAGKKFGANFFINGNGFAGERGFINRRIAFDDNSIHGNAIAGAQCD